MKTDSIPAELRALNQWVCSARDTKVPLSPDGKAASVTDPSSWSSFEACCNAARIKGFGVAFIFTADDPYVVIDLDHVRNRETGETEPWAQAIIDELSSYTELSQSGTGWHIICRGQIPANGRKHGRFEIYAAQKAMTLTGDIMPFVGGEDIETRDLASLYARLEQLDPIAPQVPGTRAGYHVTSKNGADESREDFRLLAQIKRRLRTTDARKIEDEFARRYPERVNRKGQRCGRSYIRYSIDRLLAKG